MQRPAQRAGRDRQPLPEEFAFHKYPGPGFDGFENTSAKASYYTWIDQHNAVGLGDNVPISTANLEDGFVAFKDGQMVMLRVPYPIGFYAKGLDARIDDANAAGKGAACGAQAATARHGSTNSAKGRGRSLCTSRCGPIRWRIEARPVVKAPAT